MDNGVFIIQPLPNEEFTFAGFEYGDTWCGDMSFQGSLEVIRRVSDLKGYI
tara:strand:- start:453 stop:605 length:153 start_codon:yes stop_codon:yes gene_type:complete